MFLTSVDISDLSAPATLKFSSMYHGVLLLFKSPPRLCSSVVHFYSHELILYLQRDSDSFVLNLHLDSYTLISHNSKSTCLTLYWSLLQHHPFGLVVWGWVSVPSVVPLHPTTFWLDLGISGGQGKTLGFCIKFLEPFLNAIYGFAVYSNWFG